MLPIIHIPNPGSKSSSLDLRSGVEVTIKPPVMEDGVRNLALIDPQVISDKRQVVPEANWAVFKDKLKAPL